MLIKRGKCIGGGRCDECGKCNMYDSTDRKKRMTILPEDFNPDLEVFDDNRQEHYGIAFDIGTTTVVGILWDLNKNEIIDIIAKTNPQSKYGADVISRITYSSESEKKLLVMKELIKDCFNEIIKEFTALYGFGSENIIKATVVGNTTMSHLFLGINPLSLARAPFKPVFYGPVVKTAKQMGLDMYSEAEVFLLPNIAGHVGSDIVGVIIASRIKNQTGLRLAIDVGTNGEIVLAYNGRMLTCSTAAGPAFEGARISQGMRAARGSIERIDIHDGDVKLMVIEDTDPIGICGSGLIDAIAQMLNAGIINYKGNLVNPEEAASHGVHLDLIPRIRKGQGGNEFVLAFNKKGKDIAITQKDIREVQLAKGAIYGGIVILMECLGVEKSQLEEIILAGAFGNYINKKSALRIGLFPDINEEKISHIGNAAGAGACMTLLSPEEREQALMQAKEVEHIELAIHPNFEREYIKAMYFPR